jgi:hypothetical protein
MIDLGLSSGTKWSCCNIDATNPVEKGNYYAWVRQRLKIVLVGAIIFIVMDQRKLAMILWGYKWNKTRCGICQVGRLVEDAIARPDLGID